MFYNITINIHVLPAPVRVKTCRSLNIFKNIIAKHITIDRTQRSLLEEHITRALEVNIALEI
jgi:hypothetical protein